MEKLTSDWRISNHLTKMLRAAAKDAVVLACRNPKTQAWGLFKHKRKLMNLLGDERDIPRVKEHLTKLRGRNWDYDEVVKDLKEKRQEFKRRKIRNEKEYMENETKLDLYYADRKTTSIINPMQHETKLKNAGIKRRHNYRSDRR